MRVAAAAALALLLGLSAPPAGAGPVPAADKAGSGPVDTLRDLYRRLTGCWTEPPGLVRFERTEVTVRLALKRDGSVIGTPRVTFSTEGHSGPAAANLRHAALDAIRLCTPANVTPALGAAIAGRPLALRFIYQGPKGQGV